MRVLLGATRKDAVTGGGASGKGGCDSARESEELRRGPVLAAAEDVESPHAASPSVHGEGQEHAAGKGLGGRGTGGRPGRDDAPDPSPPGCTGHVAGNEDHSPPGRLRTS